MKQERDKLSAQQSKVYRELKKLWISTRNRFMLTDRERFKLQELEEQNGQLSDQIQHINSRLLSFELFGK
jgi:hypothetical protein